MQITGRRKTSIDFSRLLRCKRSVTDGITVCAALANNSTAAGTAPSNSSITKHIGLKDTFSFDARFKLVVLPTTALRRSQKILALRSSLQKNH